MGYGFKSISGVNRTYSKYEFKYMYGAKWLKVFYHQPGVECNVFDINNEAEFLNINTKQRYSIFSELDENYKINNKYEFLLYYPDLDEYNWWRQSLLPFNDKEKKGQNQKATVYEEVDVNMKDSNWGGLVRSTLERTSCSGICTFVEGSVGNDMYYYAIGLTKESDTIPAEKEYVKDVYLWIRISGINLHLYCTKQIYIQKNSIPFLFIFIIILN